MECTLTTKGMQAICYLEANVETIRDVKEMIDIGYCKMLLDRAGCTGKCKAEARENRLTLVGDSAAVILLAASLYTAFQEKP